MTTIAPEKVPTFGTSQFLKASLPSYFAPMLSAGIPAYFLEKDELLHASYSTIALPSLIATIICFLLLAQFQKRQIFLFSRLTTAILLGFLMLGLSGIIVSLFGLQSEALTICFSAFIGAAIVSFTTPAKKINK